MSSVWSGWPKTLLLDSIVARCEAKSVPQKPLKRKKGANLSIRAFFFFGFSDHFVVVRVAVNIANAETLFQTVQKTAGIEADENGEHHQANRARETAPQHGVNVEKTAVPIVVTAHN